MTTQPTSTSSPKQARAMQAKDQQKTSTSSVTISSGVSTGLDPAVVPALIEELREAKIGEKQVQARVKNVVGRLEMYLAAGAMAEYEDAEPGRYCFDNVTLVRQSRTTYTYSQQLRQLMEAEKENGLAKAKTSEYFRTEFN